MIMKGYYTVEKHTQTLIALMKIHGVKRIVVSPGTTNITFVGSIQNDPFFEIYSSVDERSAAYMACGLARETGEPVGLSCTGATASRNYLSGLTEAYYSNLPVLAITSTQFPGRVGHLNPQVIDRSNPMNDIVKKSVEIDVSYSDEQEWSNVVKINDALLELKRYGGGPVHINVETTYSKDFSANELPKVRYINRYSYTDIIPELSGRICVYLGYHNKWSTTLTNVVDKFCENYNAVVMCEHISNYRGKYGIDSALLYNQVDGDKSLLNFDIAIHIGSVVGFNGYVNANEVWRVHPDGELRDTFKKLTKVFEMEEVYFFDKYNENKSVSETTVYNTLKDATRKLETKIPELPFSNPWIVQNTKDKLPDNSELHVGILNTLRSWDLFEVRKNIEIYSNTGGFGIDGLVSTLLGSSLYDRKKLYIGIVGDLAFFYDMNSIGNRHIGNNIRLMVINNGRGTEFRNFNHPADRFGENADEFMAAAGHYGNKSKVLLKHYSEDLGFKYLSAQNKMEYLAVVDEFLSLECDKPILLEIFTDSKDESDALHMMYHIEKTTKGIFKSTIKNILGEETTSALKKIIKK